LTVLVGEEPYARVRDKLLYPVSQLADEPERAPRAS